ncbi:hypothetical protein [Serratia sp. M24T3]|uniref:hypothetical protein n=1 Tax=Serratia sp. M24T3 TaxID=932213 RepID=UPI00025BAE84|nr:hypothetical protein [Serratia sp. M24T3]EIC82978.1 hypothetical protein SPM24T3_19383 [Serratia sp. M24T3]
MLKHFTVYGYGINKRGLTLGINYKTHSDTSESAKAAAMLKAQHDGLTDIRITRVQGVAV